MTAIREELLDVMAAAWEKNAGKADIDRMENVLDIMLEWLAVPVNLGETMGPHLEAIERRIRQYEDGEFGPEPFGVHDASRYIMADTRNLYREALGPGVPLWWKSAGWRKTAREGSPTVDS